MNTQRKPFPLAGFLALAVTAVIACDGDDGLDPDLIPDVSGFWSGQYTVTSCRLTGASEPFFCDFVFLDGAGLPLDLDLFQDGAALDGSIVQGLRSGDVGGNVDEDGSIELSGVIGPEDTLATTTILSWFSGVVVDTMLGSWTFRADDRSGLGFGTATVGANLRLFAPEVPVFFGCVLQGPLTVDGLISGELEEDDCHFFDGSFMDVYSLTASAGDTVEVTERSLSFNAFLLVYDDAQELIGGDDDSGGGFDAQLILEFTGDATVFVFANSLLAAESGAYTLSAVALNATNPSAGAVTPSGEGSGSGPVRVLSGAPLKAKVERKVAPGGEAGSVWRTFRERAAGRR